MKSITKALACLCILCALFAITATATSNDNLPSKDDVDSFLSDVKNSSSSEILDKVKEGHPTWYADLIECSTCTGNQDAVVLYYTDKTLTKGYRSVYFQDGKVVSPSTLHGYTTKESYKGELEDEKEEEESDEECTDGSCDKDSESKDVSIASDSKLTVEERKASFMEFLETKDSVTLEEVQDELDKCFPDDMEA